MFIFLIRLLFLTAIVCLLLVTLTYPNHSPLISLKNALKQKPTENEPRLCCETLEMGNYIRHQTRSLRSKRFRLVSEQGKTKERDFRNESHFSKPHGNACYAGYDFSKCCKWRASSYATKQVNFAPLSFCFYRAAREGNAQSRNESRLC